MRAHGEAPLPLHAVQPHALLRRIESFFIIEDRTQPYPTAYLSYLSFSYMRFNPLFSFFYTLLDYLYVHPSLSLSLPAQIRPHLYLYTGVLPLYKGLFNVYA